MFDKIIALLLIPFYGIWKYLISRNIDRKKSQKLLFRVYALFWFIAYYRFFNDSPHFLFKVVFGVVLTFLFLFLLFAHKISENFLKGKEIKMMSNKWKEYRDEVVFIFTLIFISLTSGYLPILFLAIGRLVCLFILVGFEFPDEPPKKKESESKDEGWLAKLLSPRPVTSN